MARPDDHRIIILRPRGADDPHWLALRGELWPQCSPAEHRREMAEAFDRGDGVYVALMFGPPVGLVEATKRHDYVNGTHSSPVAFLEGLYVRPAARRRGVARRLVDRVMTWARAEGLTELASDALVSNAASLAMHRALGFAETERVVYFGREVR